MEAEESNFEMLMKAYLESKYNWKDPEGDTQRLWEQINKTTVKVNELESEIRAFVKGYKRKLQKSMDDY